MGRELRRVPPNWEHPRDDRGQFIPLFDEDFEAAFAQWHENLHLWLDGEYPDKPAGYADTVEDFYMWEGTMSEPGLFRPRWTDEERSHFQVYETVSEGTPVSPVFATTTEVIDWWVNIGDTFNGRLTQEQAERWVEVGSSPTMVVYMPGGIKPGTDLFS